MARARRDRRRLEARTERVPEGHLAVARGGVAELRAECVDGEVELGGKGLHGGDDVALEGAHGAVREHVQLVGVRRWRRGVPVAGNTVVDDHVRVLGQRVRLDAAPDDVDRLCCPCDGLEGRVDAVELLGELRQCLVAVGGLRNQLAEVIREVWIVRSLALQLLVVRVVSVQVNFVRVGFKGRDQ